MTDEDVVDTLNDLIETSKDGEYGFRACAEHVKSEQLRTVLLARAESCRKAAAELRAEVARRGGKAESDGSTVGTIHRGWVDLKAMLSGDSDRAALDECERGEDSALKSYREAIKKDLPGDVAAIVERQYVGVKRNHDQIRALRNAARSATG